MSYTSSAALAPNGGLWVKHGDSHGIELLDGYSIRRYPEPGGHGRIDCARDGTLWTWSGDVLMRLLPSDGSDSRWSSFAVDDVTNFGVLRFSSDEAWEITSARGPYYTAVVSVVSIDRTHALIMLPDRVLEFDADRSSSRVVALVAQTGLSRFLTMRAARDGTVWLTGSGGVGRLRNIRGSIATEPEYAWQWNALPRPPSPWVDFTEPLDVQGTGLFVTGAARSQARAALRFDGHGWKEVFSSDSATMRAWPDLDGSLWIQDGNHIFEVAGGEKHIAEKTGALSGIILGVTPQSPGRFWVGSSQGLALHATPLWKSPPGAPQFDDVVNAITEDHSGNLWFLSAHHLIRYDNSTWTSYPLPRGETAWPIFTEGPGVLPDGRLVILTTTPHWLIFDPGRHTFRVVEHPEKRTLLLFVQGQDGKLIAETFPAGSSSGMKLESFDGNHFRPLYAPGDLTDLRNIRVRPNGDILAGSTGFFGVHRGSRTETIGPADGYKDRGAYYIYDDPAGPLVVGGEDGLYQQEGEKWRVIRNGLDRVRNIIRTRDGTLWTASGSGIHRYRDGVWITNSTEEGLPSSVAYKVFQDSRGRIWAGTTRGLSLFNPSADTDPPIVTMSDEQNAHEAPPGGKVRLQFTGEDRWKMTLPARLLYSHRIDGGAWTPFEPGDSVSYDRLQAGSHRFEVRAMDRNGNISVRPASHAFSVLLPWYATLGFRFIATGAAGIICLLLTLALRSYRNRGDLIQVLNRTNKLERDREMILESIALRDPLTQIMQRVADSVAENCAGSVCAVILNHEAIRGIFAHPVLPPPLLESLEGAIFSSAPASCDSATDWWRDVASLSRDYFAGPCQIVPIRSGDHGVFGVVTLFSGTETPQDSGRGLPETFANIAAAAIENARLYERLAYQAHHDVLTGLPNRLSFDDQLRDAVAGATENVRTLAILYLDLDRFKQINDSLGHRIGDLFLTKVAERLSGALNGEATLARIGGDEFTILLERGVGKSAVERLASAMLESLHSAIQIEGHDLFASASIGASFFPDDGATATALQKHADIAMYRAKAKGRNCIEFFAPEMGSVTDAALDVEQIVRRALEHGGFEVHYQPQFTLAAEMVGFEALLRLKDPDRGFVSPGEFIPIAEETGLIVPIGALVLREACRQLRQWLDEGFPPTRMAVNVSALEIVGDSFANGVAITLAEAGIDPRLLELEITESAIARNPAESVRQMHKLRSLGIRLAIDDFGTGYSSFASLQNLPLDTLKIDRSFLLGTAAASNSAQLMRTIVDLGHNLGLTVLAEGVETEEQMAVLRASQCDLVQGYFYGRPQPASKARGFLVAAAELAETLVGAS